MPPGGCDGDSQMVTDAQCPRTAGTWVVAGGDLHLHLLAISMLDSVRDSCVPRVEGGNNDGRGGTRPEEREARKCKRKWELKEGTKAS